MSGMFLATFDVFRAADDDLVLEASILSSLVLPYFLQYSPKSQLAANVWPPSLLKYSLAVIQPISAFTELQVRLI